MDLGGKLLSNGPDANDRFFARISNVDLFEMNTGHDGC
jgi:hypothetical protein